MSTTDQHSQEIVLWWDCNSWCLTFRQEDGHVFSWMFRPTACGMFALYTSIIKHATRPGYCLQLCNAAALCKYVHKMAPYMKGLA